MRMRAPMTSRICFDFNQTPLVFQPVTAQYDANYFLNDKRPPGHPDDD